MRFVLIVALMILVIPIGLDPFGGGKKEERTPFLRAARTATTQSQIRKITKKPVGRSPRLADDYKKSLIDGMLHKNRYEVGTCLMEYAESKVVDVEMKIIWKGVGIFDSIRIRPALNDKTVGCLSELVDSWELPADPGLRPYTYTVSLRPTLK